MAVASRTAGNESNWHEISPSEFTHEREGLRRLRSILPSHPPYEVWSNFEFMDTEGRIHEVDALVNTPGGLYLLELKHYGGTLTGDQNTWTRGNHSVSNPLFLANRKAKRLASLLTAKLRELDARLDDGRMAQAPFIHEAVFLHADDFTCKLPLAARAKLYGNERDVVLAQGLDPDTELPALSELIYAPQDRRHLENLVVRGGLLNELLRSVGVSRKVRSVQDWLFDGGVIAETEAWQEWPVKNKFEESELARIRFYPPKPEWSHEQKLRHSNLIKREYRLTRDLRHTNILSPHGFLIEEDLGPGLILKLPPSVPTLAAFMDARGAGLALDTRVALIRDLAEAVLYAHRSNVVHRGLNPEVIYVDENADGSPRVLVSNWRLAGRAERTELVEPGTVHTGLDLLDGQDAYTAPEQRVYADKASRVVLDVFSVGAVAFHILTGQAPADNFLNLRKHLSAQRHLDVSALDPSIPEPLRQVIMLATAASHSARQEKLGDLSLFVQQLDAAMQPRTPDDRGFVSIDDAQEGNRLSDEFVFVARLGRGASAVGVQVEGPDSATKMVLKVSRGPEHDTRVAREAETLKQLQGAKSKSLVRLLRDEPILVGGRQALVLSFAGKTTLADQLRQRDRLNLDRLETWGGDLLQAVCDLASAGVPHRDIKPSNLGVLDGTKERPRLVLFDFSLSHAPSDDLAAGTHPYLDPFLGGARRHWDTAAELYAAAVTLYQMASGELIRYGDNEADDPAMVSDGPSILSENFDEAVRGPMTAFFERALAREARERFGTAEEMRAAWSALFSAELSTMDSASDSLAAAASGSTTIFEAGLSDRAVSALAALGVRTVADVVQMHDVTPVRLRASNATREEILRRRKEWTERLGETVKVAPGVQSAELEETARRVVELVPARQRVLRGFVQATLGLDGHGEGLDVFAPQTEQYERLGFSAQAQVSQQVAKLRKLIDDQGKRAEVNELLGGVYRAMAEAIMALGSAATVDEVQASLTAAAGADARGARLLRGLMALALHLVGDDFVAKAAIFRIAQRRYNKNSPIRVRGLALANDDVVWPALDTLGAQCSELVGALGEKPLVPHKQVLARLLLSRPPSVTATGDRLVQLGAMWSADACATWQGELYSATLSTVSRIRVTLVDVVEGQRISSRDLRERVKTRFPDGAALPTGERWVEAVREAFPRLALDGEAFAVDATSMGGTTGLSTVMTAAPAPRIRARERTLGRDFEASLDDRGFLAIAVPDSRVDEYRDAIVTESKGIEVNVTDVFIDALKRRRSQSGKPTWQRVLEADAAEPGSPGALGLANLVAASIPFVTERIEAAMEEAASRAATGEVVPVVLSEAAPLAAYGHMEVLARLTELGSNYRRCPVWLVVPHKVGSGAPTLDGTPLPLAFDGQMTVLVEKPIFADAVVQPVAE